MNLLGLAFSFLTIFPVRLRQAPAAGDLGRAAGWFPWIGLLLGGLAALAWWGLRWIVSPWLGAALTALLWIALSGGLHLDGLADCCDGMLNASKPERRLEIMKDPRLGTFGGLGLIFAVVLKIAFLAELPVSAGLWLPLAAALGRWMLLPLGKQPQARPGGLGADFAAGLMPRGFILAALAVILAAAGCGWQGAAALLLAHCTGWLILRCARERLGGVTGDVLGLAVECVELMVLAAGCLLAG